MKTAIYIEEGVQQLVLTPENSFEENICSMISSKESIMEIKRGSFYACQGGWIRQNNSDDKSLMFVIKEQKDIV